MQVILMEKVVNLGVLGDIVKVKDGYARNFLIPTKKAKRATPANIAEFEAKRALLEQVQQEILAKAQELGQKLEGLTVQIEHNAGVDGKLFGSVTNVDISEALKARGFEVEKAAIRLPEGPLKQLGEHAISIALHADVVPSITVSVVAA
ncbi:MAG: 50S ribosomal protein L9 [Burkholderiales bacterium]|nr:50S ribosomal protein L9 [Burkholderiales bacterium]